ncbi:TlpA family protein disulfide reductase [Chryseobacterium lathyri]|nr:TlpA disulfide reductase family protein [Chryseobacterium lathyri]
MKYLILTLVYCLLTLNYGKAAPKNKTKDETKVAFITVSFDKQLSNDSVDLTYRDNNWGIGSAELSMPLNTISAKIGEPIKIIFEKQQAFLYANLITRSGKVLFLSSIVEPSDNIEIKIYNERVIFSGRGKEKLQFKNKIEEDFESWRKTQTNLSFFKEGKSNIVKKALKEFKPKIKKHIFQIIKADYLFDANFDFMYVNYEDFIRKSESKLGMSDKVLNESSGYLNYILKAIMMRKLEPQTAVEYINKNFHDILRDRLLTLYFINKSIKNNQDVALISDVLKTIKTDYCIDALKNFKANSSPKSPAYDFALRDTSGNIVRQSDFKGKIVLLDFFFTGCGWCQLLNEKMTGIYQLFKNNPNIIFVSISIDRDQKMWKNSIKNHKYTHPGSIDLYTNDEGSKSKIIEHYNIKSYPHTILIDKDGRIVSASPPEPHTPKEENYLIELINSCL